MGEFEARYGGRCGVCDEPIHVVPNMAYGCGGSILTKQGGFVVGAAGDFDRVGCPDCRAIGQAALLEEQAAQQGRQADVS